MSTFNPNSCFVMDAHRMHLGGNMKGGDPHSFTPEVWAWLIETYKPKSVLDVGCGTGDAIDWFGRHGVPAVGIEGLDQNAEKCPAPVIVHDFTQGSLKLSGFDLVWSCEVAEHIEERFAGNFLDAVCCGKVAAITACPVGGGFHHVNEKPRTYWIERIEKRGFRYMADLSEAARLMPVDPKNYFKRDGMIFERIN